MLHEFSTIPKVTEDVTDVILNLKELVLRSELDEPATVYLKAKGPAEVTAGDISPPAGVEILNPDLHIATLGKGATLEMEMVVERGVGYRPAEKNKKPRDPIGVIPVDSIFSPVRRVTYSVENTRVEQMTDRDRLILDVETDGSMTAREAVASAGATLLELVNLFNELAESQGIAIGPAEDDGAVGRLATTIEELNLSVRSYNCLKREGINTVGDLVQRPSRSSWTSGTSARSRSTRSRPSSRSSGWGSGRSNADAEEGTAPRRRAGAPAATCCPGRPRRAVHARGHHDHRGQGEAAAAVRREAHHVRQARRRAGAARGAEGRARPRRRAQAVRRDRPAVRRAQRRVHADPEDRAAARATARRWRASSWCARD